MTLMERLRSGVHADLSPTDPMVPAPSPTTLACAVCGQAAEDGRVTEAKDVTPIGPTGRRGTERTLDLGTCDACAARAGHGRAIVTTHPGLVAAYGPGSAPVVVGHVLDALAVLGQPLPAEDVPDTDLAALIHHLNEPGAALAWRRWASAERAGQVASWPFAYLSGDRLTALRTAYGAYLHERAMRGRPPVRLGPPEDSARPGCLFCGVGGVKVDAAWVARDGKDAVQAEVWRSMRPAPPSLGGRGSTPLRGHVCSTCAQAAEAVGSIGPSALSRALVTWLRSSGAEQVAASVERAEMRVQAGEAYLRIIGWGALPPGTPANAAPWAHLDLSEME